MAHSLPPLQLNDITKDSMETSPNIGILGRAIWMCSSWTRLQNHGATPFPGQQQRPFSCDSASTHEKDAECFLDMLPTHKARIQSSFSVCEHTAEHTDVLGWMDFPGHYWNYFLPQVYLWDGSLGGHVSSQAGIRVYISTLLVSAQSLWRFFCFVLLDCWL